MTVEVAFATYAAVHILGAYLIGASGVWADLFGRFRDLTGRNDDTEFADRPREWIDNHEFWTLESPEPDSDDEQPETFWGTGS